MKSRKRGRGESSFADSWLEGTARKLASKLIGLGATSTDRPNLVRVCKEEISALEEYFMESERVGRRQARRMITEERLQDLALDMFEDSLSPDLVNLVSVSSATWVETATSLIMVAEAHREADEKFAWFLVAVARTMMASVSLTYHHQWCENDEQIAIPHRGWEVVLNAVSASIEAARRDHATHDSYVAGQFAEQMEQQLTALRVATVVEGA